MCQYIHKTNQIQMHFLFGTTIRAGKQSPKLGYVHEYR